MSTPNLLERTCTPCRGGVPPLTPGKAARYRQATPEWDLLENSRMIRRTYQFANFSEAFAFVKRAGEIA